MNLTENNLEIFFGEATATAARVYARYRGDAADRITLAGTVVGPHSHYARTLPFDVPLRNVAGAETPIAEAIVPDPCFWTPDAPYTYRVAVQVRSDSKTTSPRPLAPTGRGQGAGEEKQEVVFEAVHTLGIRRLGTRGKDLMFDGRRWVLRGISRHALASRSFGEPGAGGDDPSSLAPAGRGQGEGGKVLASLRETATALVIPSPSDQLCEACSRIGVLVVAEVDAQTFTVSEELFRLARWPAVAMAIVHQAPAITERPKNLLLAAPAETIAADAAPWADVAVHRAATAAELAEQANRIENLGTPRVMMLSSEPSDDESIASARRRCDQLQRELAQHGDFAGYVVPGFGSQESEVGKES